jgi:hypothetical protein
MDPDGGTGGGSFGFGGGSAAGGGFGGGSDGTGGGGMHVIEDAGVTCDGGETFAVVQASVLNSCSSGPIMNCHTRSPYDGQLDLDPAAAFGNLVNTPAFVAFKLRVAPGDPLGSFLTQKLTNKQGPTEGAPMPQGEGIIWQPPDPEKLRTLECWILEGAKHE